MKNWKIKKMSYQELSGQIRAIGSLLYYYQQGRSYPNECPLCVVAKKYHPRTTTCSCCLWAIIENMTCGDFVDENIGWGVGTVTSTNLSEWHQLRIPMLRRWRRIIQAERDARTEGGGP